MICILALIVFGIMAIFSATYRPLALEAFDCVFRKMTFRKCHTGLDKRLKGNITGKLMKRHKGFAKFIYKYFEIISWLFLILFLVSMTYTVIGGYNYYLYGNCNGPNDEGFCIFDPTGSNEQFSESDSSCGLEEANPESLAYFLFNKNLFFQSNPGANNTFVFIGCYACPFSRKGYPDVIKFKENDDVNFVYVHFPAKKSTEFITPYLVCLDAIDTELIFKLNKKLYSAPVEEIVNESFVKQKISNLGINMKDLEKCVLSEETKEKSLAITNNLDAVGIYGTPTVFVNGETLVGPKPFRVYKRLLN